MGQGRSGKSPTFVAENVRRVLIVEQEKASSDVFPTEPQWAWLWRVIVRKCSLSESQVIFSQCQHCYLKTGNVSRWFRCQDSCRQSGRENAVRVNEREFYVWLAASPCTFIHLLNEIYTICCFIDFSMCTALYCVFWCSNNSPLSMRVPRYCSASVKHWDRDEALLRYMQYGQKQDKLVNNRSL